ETGRRLERAVPRRLQHVPEERHVPGVVLDDEDLAATHHGAGGADGTEVAGGTGSVNTKVLPFPTSLSTQMRPPWSSTSRFDSASPRPVPSRCSLPAAACWN